MQYNFIRNFNKMFIGTGLIIVSNASAGRYASTIGHSELPKMRPMFSKTIFQSNDSSILNSFTSQQELSTMRFVPRKRILHLKDSQTLPPRVQKILNQAKTEIANEIDVTNATLKSQAEIKNLLAQQAHTTTNYMEIIENNQRRLARISIGMGTFAFVGQMENIQQLIVAPILSFVVWNIFGMVENSQKMNKLINSQKENGKTKN